MYKGKGSRNTLKLSEGRAVALVELNSILFKV